MDATTTDVGSRKWLVEDDNDRPFRVRHWASDVVHLLPEKHSEEQLVGRASSCAIHLSDPRVSKEHARLYFRDHAWRLRNLSKKNRLVVDGTPAEEAVLEPGFLIEIGGITWIVENHRLIALRSFLSRLLGYGVQQFADVDQALRNVRKAALGQAPLVLVGDGDLVAIARSLHHRVIGEARPFVVCDPRRKRTPGNVRSAENYPKAFPALQAAIGGSLCVWSNRVPRDFGLVAIAHREPNARFQLIMCGHGAPEINPQQVAQIVIPPLSRRADELDDIIDAYAADARASFGVASTLLAQHRRWIADTSATTHPEIERGARRVIAIRANGGNIAAAAAMLGMSHTALLRWLGERRPLPDVRGSGAA